MSNAERFVTAFTKTWQKRDPGGFLELFHPEGTLFHPVMERPLRREEVPDHVARTLAILPDIRVEVKTWASQDDTVFIEWSTTATFRGQRIQWEGADRFTLRGDRATAGVAYYDTLPLWAAIDPRMKRTNILAAVDSSTAVH
jgi:ketosteroid isomerase-like protein